MIRKEILAPKFLGQYSPLEYHEYVKGLHSLLKPPPKTGKAPARDISFRRNRKGTPIITIRNRDPKYITLDEFKEIRLELELPINVLDLILRKRKIPILDPKNAQEIKIKINNFPWGGA